MSERSYAELRIGGEVSYPVLKKLLEDAEDLDLDSGLMGSAGSRLYLDPIGDPEQGHHLVLADEYRRGGFFDPLETRLVEAGVMFDRFSADAPGAWASTLRVVRGPQQDQEWTVGDDRKRIFDLVELEVLRDTPGATLTEWLQTHWAPPPPLPPLVLLDWTGRGLG